MRSRSHLNRVLVIFRWFSLFFSVPSVIPVLKPLN